MQTITLTRDLDSETLHLPELRPLFGHRVEIVVRDQDPAPLRSGARAALLVELERACERCAQPDWDNEGATAISAETQAAARRLIEAIPNDLPLPVLTAEPDGQLNFEWYRSPQKLVTACLSDSGTLFWAALIGSEDPRGSCPFMNEFPRTLSYWIQQVYGD